MTRTRVVALLVVVALCGVGLTALMAAKEAGNKEPARQPATTAGGKKLVCFGFADTEDPIVRIFPDNFPMPSKVTKVLAREGDFVTAGQPLLEFDVELLKLKVKEAEKGILVAQAEREKAVHMVNQYQPQLDAAENKLKAKKEELNSKNSALDEAKRAFKYNQITQNELDAATAAFKAAQFNLAAAQVEWDGIKKDGAPEYLIKIADKSIERLENLKEQAQMAVNLCSCKAPADGQLIRSYVTEGFMFGPQIREPAFLFLKKGPLVIRAEVNQEFARRVYKGAGATIADDADSEQTWFGKVIKVGDQFLLKRNIAGGMPDMMMMSSDDRVLECLVSIDPGSGKTPLRFGQKVRVTLDE
jgi:multidrug resistance efflux pump